MMNKENRKINSEMVAENIKSFMKYRGKKQRDLAKHLDFSEAYLSKLLNERSNKLSIDHLCGISECLVIPLQGFLIQSFENASPDAIHDMINNFTYLSQQPLQVRNQIFALGVKAYQNYQVIMEGKKLDLGEPL